MRYLFLTLAAVLVTACSGASQGTAFDKAPKAPTTIDFDSNFVDVERAQVSAGFAEWPALPGGDWKVYRVTAKTPGPKACPPADAPPSIYARSAADDLGYTDAGSKTICLYFDHIVESSRDSGVAADVIIQATAAHEFGHALGLFETDADHNNGHYTGPNPSLMRASLTPGQLDVAQQDLDDLAQFGN